MAGLTTLFVVGKDEYVEFNESLGSKAMLEHVWDESATPLTSEETTSTKLHSTGARISPKPPYRIEFPTIRRIKGKGNTYQPTGRWFSWEELARRNPLAVQPPPKIEDLRASSAEGGIDSNTGKRARLPAAEPIVIGTEPRVAAGEWLGADNRIKERQAAAAAIASASKVDGEIEATTDSDGWIGKGASESIYAPQVVKPAKQTGSGPGSIPTAKANGATDEVSALSSKGGGSPTQKAVNPNPSSSPATRAKSSQMEAMLLRLRLARAGLPKSSEAPPAAAPTPAVVASEPAASTTMSKANRTEKLTKEAGTGAKSGQLEISSPIVLSPGAAALAARLGAIPIQSAPEQSVPADSAKTEKATPIEKQAAATTSSGSARGRKREGRKERADTEDNSNAIKTPVSLDAASMPVAKQASNTHGQATSAFREEFSAATAPIFSSPPAPAPPLPTGPKERRSSAGKNKSQVPSGPRKLRIDSVPASLAPLDTPTGPSSMRERGASPAAAGRARDPSSVAKVPIAEVQDSEQSAALPHSPESVLQQHEPSVITAAAALPNESKATSSPNGSTQQKTSEAEAVTSSEPAPQLKPKPKAHINWADEDDSSSADDDLLPPEWGITTLRSSQITAAPSAASASVPVVTPEHQKSNTASIPDSSSSLSSSRWATAPVLSTSDQSASLCTQPQDVEFSGRNKKATKRGGKARAKKEADRSESSIVSTPSQARQSRPPDIAAYRMAIQSSLKGSEPNPTGPLRGWGSREFATSKGPTNNSGLPPTGPRADRERYSQSARNAATPPRGPAAGIGSSNHASPHASGPANERRPPVTRPRVAAGGAFARLAQGIVVGSPEPRNRSRAGAS